MLKSNIDVYCCRYIPEDLLYWILCNYTSLYCYQQWMSALFTPQPHQLSLVLLILTILTLVRWNIKAFLICMSMMTKNIEHVFLHVSGILFMFLKFSVQISTSFLIKLLSYLSFFQFFIQFRYQSFMRCIVVKNLFQLYSLLCYRMMVSFVRQKTFRFMNYHLPIVVLSPCVIGICLESPFLCQWVQSSSSLSLL